MARPASDIRLRIVMAARDCFLVDGVQGASLRAIARAAGTNLGMVYYYHSTKDELFFAVVEEIYGKLLADLEVMLAAAPHETRMQVDALYQRFAALSDDEHKVLRLILREAMSTDSGRLARLFERFSRGHLPLFAKLIHAGVSQGEVRADVPPMVMAITTLVVGVMPQLMRRRFAEAELAVDDFLPASAELARLLAGVLLRGLAPSAAVPREEPPR
jgi:AcrR family transcriptional regulator